MEEWLLKNVGKFVAVHLSYSNIIVVQCSNIEFKIRIMLVL